MTGSNMNNSTFWWIYWSVGIANSGLGYLLSTFIPRRNLTLYAALLVVLIGAFFSGILPYMSVLKKDIVENDGLASKIKFAVASVSYSRWSVEALVTTEMMLGTRGRNDVIGAEMLSETGLFKQVFCWKKRRKKCF